MKNFVIYSKVLLRDGKLLKPAYSVDKDNSSFPILLDGLVYKPIV